MNHLAIIKIASDLYDKSPFDLTTEEWAEVRRIYNDFN